MLTLEQARVESEREILAETEMRLKAESQACADSEQHKIYIQRARMSAQAKIELEQEASRVARKLAELEEHENVRLQARIAHSRKEIITRRLIMGLNRIRNIGRPGKTAGIIAAFILIGFSLQPYSMQLDGMVKPFRADMTRADKIVADVAQGGLKSESIRPQGYIALDNLKLTDHLGE